ncbi:MAG: hypothetical protein Q9209_007457 [Squamulea sp. 1 TL-2023]
MDHIPYPVSTSVPPLEIPLLVHDTVGSCDAALSALEEAADPDGLVTEADSDPIQGHSIGTLYAKDSGSETDWTSQFWRYPEKQRWRANDSQSWWTSNTEETVRRAQEWLYFELLHRFLGESIDVSSLARKDQNCERILLDSSVVPELLNRWSTRQHTSEHDGQDYVDTESERLWKKGRVLSLLARVTLECQSLDGLPGPSQCTALAIMVLVETLMNAIYNHTHVNVTGDRKIHKIEYNPLLNQRFLSNYWCPFQVARLWGQYSPSTTYYLSSLPREPTFGGVKHDECNEHRCRTTSIDPSTYEPHHADSCSTDLGLCHMVGVQSTKVAECIERGGIPLIRFEESANGTLRPEIIESRRGLRYVALSHVWSGGLGNVNMNSMFSCQVRKIYNLLLRLRNNGDDEHDRNLGTRKFPDAYQDLRNKFGMPLPEPPILLWIDTMCVPVGQEHVETRESAIAQMAQIYVEAQCVLVVDPELQKMNHKDLPNEQIFASVLCSSWNSRSWTFQEACMARVFYVQFLDGHCVIDERWHKFMQRISESTPSGTTILNTIDQHVVNAHNVLMAEVSDWFRTMPVMTKIRGYDARTLMSRSEDWQNFVRVWNGLRRRSTTKPEDLYGIIAIMVDLSADEILKLHPRERMRAILRSQATLPIPLLYQDCAKLCDLEGKPLWAPSEIAGTHLEMDRGYMSVEDDGLLIKSHQSDTARHTWPGVYIFSTEGLLPTIFSIRLVHLGITISIELCQGTPAQTTESIHSWVILCKEVLNQDSFTFNTSGVLLSLRSQEGSIIETDYVCPLRASYRSRIDGDSKDKNRYRKPEILVQSTEAQCVSLNESSIKVHTGKS